VRAGPLRYTVTIQQLVAGSPQQKPTGEPDKTWSALASVPADIRPLAGQALFVAQQANARVNVEVDLRYSSEVAGVTAGMRVLHGATVYDIEWVPPLKPARGHRFTLRCSTGLNQG
jgi:SPP1 family predicted phage head-tail adaptor